MKQEMDCEVVKDLLPSYADKLTSEKTNEILKSHLDTCEDCRKELEHMLYELHTDNGPKNNELKKYLNKTKIRYLLKGILLSIGILGIFCAFCVDLAINYQLTWSLIVDMGIIYAYSVLFTGILLNRGKLVGTITVACVLLIPMLFGMEYVLNTRIFNQPEYWFKDYALPISIIWIVIAYMALVIWYLFKKFWYMLGAILILTSIGSILTDAISEKMTVIETLNTGFDWIDAMVYFVLGILCIIIGRFRKKEAKDRFRI